MTPRTYIIHARNQIRTVWLMTGRRFASPYDIQTRNPSLGLSFVALLIGNGLIAVYDYLNYPTDLIGGYIPEDMSRLSYVTTLGASNLLSIVLSYGALFLLAMPLGYSKRFWHGLIAGNWWGLMATFVTLPLLLFGLLLGDDDPFLSPLLALMFLVFVVIIWKTILLNRHVLRISSAKAVLITLVFILVEAGAMALVYQMAGISLV